MAREGIDLALDADELRAVAQFLGQLGLADVTYSVQIPGAFDIQIGPDGVPITCRLDSASGRYIIDTTIGI